MQGAIGQTFDFAPGQERRRAAVRINRGPTREPDLSAPRDGAPAAPAVTGLEELEGLPGGHLTREEGVFEEDEESVHEDRPSRRLLAARAADFVTWRARHRRRHAAEAKAAAAHAAREAARAASAS